MFAATSAPRCRFLCLAFWPLVLASVCLAAAAVGASSARADEAEGRAQPLRCQEHPGRLEITQGGRAIATYVYQDHEIRRPYFANVHAPGGIPVTRHHPPRAGLDPVDHATMHPGLWLAFGELSGHDFWRNKAQVEHEGFAKPPETTAAGAESVLTFAVRQRYVAEGQVVAQEVARHAVVATTSGYLFTFDSEFSSERPLVFGDQEEMGLGVRVATPIAVKGGTGQILNSHGQRDEKQVWGQPADWCDYSGLVPADDPGKDDRPAATVRLRAGLLLVPHPENFRRSWMHARDYGLVVANAFGQRAFTEGPASRVEVPPGKTLRLRYGVWAYATPEDAAPDRPRLAAEYARLAADAPAQR